VTPNEPHGPNALTAVAEARKTRAAANVFVSFFVERNKAQREAALAPLGAAEEGQFAGDLAKLLPK